MKELDYYIRGLKKQDAPGRLSMVAQFVTDTHAALTSLRRQSADAETTDVHQELEFLREQNRELMALVKDQLRIIRRLSND